MTNVLVIEDEPDLNEALLALLGVLGYESTGATTGVGGLATAVRTQPDLVILDLGLPDLPGLDVLESLRRWTSAPVLVLSGTSRRHSRAAALDAGADDFLQKPFDAGELSARLRAVMRRADASGDDHSQQRSFGPIRVDVSGQRLFVHGDEVRLTALEWRLLEALTRHPDRPLTHRWLITQMWNRHHGTEAQASLRTHVRALRRKLGDDAMRPRFVRTESGIGYRWVGPGQHLAAVSPTSNAQAAWDSVKASLDAALVALTQVSSHPASAEVSRLVGTARVVVENTGEGVTGRSDDHGPS